MRSLIVCMAIVALAAAPALGAMDTDPTWHAWKSMNRKSFATASEEGARYAVFLSNVAKVKALNEAHVAAGGGEVYGVDTPFMDLTEAEFSSRLGYKPAHERAAAVGAGMLRATHVEAEAAAAAAASGDVDWRTKHAVTPVKNQGQCGSCWAFSVVEEIESCWFLAGNPLPVLSVQQIIDCDGTDSGCQGGEPMTAYKYVETAGGLDSEAEYPYQADKSHCHFRKNNITAHIKGFKYATPPDKKDETQMQAVVAKTAPLSVCVDASSWQFYSGGVLKQCGQQLDHCVQAVGYKKTEGGFYWIVRNSWGESWGESGYINIEGGSNTCGIADMATYVEI